MQHYLLRLLLLCLAFICPYITLADSVLTGRKITTGDGLPSNLIHDIVQDNQGYIWMGTPNGLCRYDGYSFVNFETIGCGNSEVSANSLHTFSFFTKEPHGIWLYDRVGLVRHVMVNSQKRVTVQDYPNASLPLREARVRRVMVDSLNNAWLYPTAMPVLRCRLPRGSCWMKSHR